MKNKRNWKLYILYFPRTEFQISRHVHVSLWIFDLLTMSESKENNENMANTNTNTTLTRYPVTLRDDQRIPVRAFCDPTPPANGFRFSTHEAVDPTRFIVSLSPEDSHRVFVYPHCAPSVEYEDQNLWTDDLVLFSVRIHMTSANSLLPKHPSSKCRRC